MADFNLDKRLLQAVADGRAVLFLGAGASLGATRADGTKIPDGVRLTKAIVDKFLGPGYESLDFKGACDLAASARSVRDLQIFINDTLSGYRPAPSHLLLPKFIWAGLVTTNYDLLIEEAYKTCDEPLQEVVPYRKDNDGAVERLGKGRILYVKLHGCLSLYQEIAPPFVASTEQIINHREGRAGQFAQFLEWAKTKTIIFAGYAFGDQNLRTLIEEIRREGDNRPRHYIVRPGIREAEIGYWSERRMQPVPMEFLEFLRALDSELKPESRVLALLPQFHDATSFTKFISKSDRSESAALRAYLSSHCEHVSQDTDAKGPDGASPQRFYEGFDLAWYPFAQSLDTPRRVTAAMLTEQVLPLTTSAGPRFAVVKAPAGTGKTVVLRRLAWDAARAHSRLVFFIDFASNLNADAFEEIFQLTNQPVLLVVDDVAEAPDGVQDLLRRARSQKWPLTLIGGARTNEWNIRCEHLESLLDETYEIGHLSYAEIDDLLERLEKHNCLGHLATVTFEERRKRLREIYERQLLVALHELTKNASFRDIIRNEFMHIFPPEAQVLYLDICALHRFGPPVRAGLIARVHGIDFDEFERRFFKPLDAVVALKWDERYGDWVYRARHSYIAAIVYSEILSKVDDRFDNIIRIVGKLNPDYSYDREVLFQLVRGGSLAESFRDRTRGDAIYDAVMTSIGRDGAILHQRGIYEMRLGGDQAALDRAERYLTEALEKLPNNRAVRHSLAELAFARSKIDTDALSRASWRRKAEAQAQVLTKAGNSSYPYHTMAKAAVAAVEDALENAENDGSELSQEALAQAIRHAEDTLRAALQRFPNDSHLLAEDASLGQLLNKADRALVALERAFKSNPRSELIARRYARVLRAKGRLADAISVLRLSLEQNTGNQRLHYELAQALLAERPNADTTNPDTILYHLRQSFAVGDNNYEAQFWYARQLCLMGRSDEAKSFFAKLRQLQLPFSQKRGPRAFVRDEESSLVEFQGVVYMRQPTFGFIRADRDGMEVYFSVSADDEASDNLRPGQRVHYGLGFTLFGPVAVNAIALLV